MSSNKRQKLLFGQYGSSPYTRAAFATGNLIRAAAPYAKRAYSALETIRKKRTIAGPVSSFQNDNVPRYRYKRMPAKKRKRWVRFVKRIRHVNLSMQPLQIYTKKVNANSTTLVNVGGSYSYMIGGTTVTLNDEILQMFKGAYAVASADAAKAYKLYLKSLVLDMMITNTGSATAIVDVYRLRYVRDFSSAITVHAQLTQALGEVVADSTTNTLSATDVSVTPFDAPNFCQYWKVVSKREIVMGAGQTATMQIRKPHNKYIDGKVLTTNNQAIPGFSEAFLIMWHGAPTAVPDFAATALSFGTTLVGHYAIPPGKTQEAGRTG